MNSEYNNIVDWLFYQAESRPDKIAYQEHIANNSRVLDFAELKSEIIHCSYLLQQYGVKKNSKVLLLTRPNADLAITIFAIFGVGAVPVIIDPAMGLSTLLKSIAKVKPQFVICKPLVKYLLPLFRNSFSTIERIITTTDLNNVKVEIQGQPAIVNDRPTRDDLAAIFFTSGSTDLPKPVEWTHRQLLHHVNSVPLLFPLTDNDIDLALFPLSMLISPVLGITCHIPDYKKASPKSADCCYLYELINQVNPTICFASPAVWYQLAEYCQKRQLGISSIRYAVSGGAPITGKAAEKLQKILRNGQLLTPYGATEASPIANTRGICFSEKKGVKLGHPVTGITIEIKKHSHIAGKDELQTVGEIMVSGDLVSQHYHLSPELDAAAKITVGSTCWHLTGDLGVFDEDKQLWYLGRLKDAVCCNGRCYFTAIAEESINQLPLVRRSALLTIEIEEAPIIIIVIETERRLTGNQKQQVEWEVNKKITEIDYAVDKILFIKQMPVDKRHYSKIDRADLRQWAINKVTTK